MSAYRISDEKRFDFTPYFRLIRTCFDVKKEVVLGKDQCPESNGNTFITSILYYYTLPIVDIFIISFHLHRLAISLRSL